ncbi:hypothetical protein [Roseiconus lacunae]|nr:hypothetical protein [Roseiconus lacunae]
MNLNAATTLCSSSICGVVVSYSSRLSRDSRGQSLIAEPKDLV